ncbi:MAG TPA: MAPEG family protein [Candidatus Macondimonas sp.]|nr:MAPEG family protein [Candidatus Macondimonas sp.]
MSAELFWLTWTVILTAFMFFPYVLNRIAIRGLFGAMGNPRSDDLPESDWARRAMRAHANAVENLVVFAPLVLMVELVGANSGLTAFGAALYFWARLVHYAVYAMGIPIVRTLSFFAGLAGEVLLMIALIGAM